MHVDCQRIFRKLLDLAKVAHYGRHGLTARDADFELALAEGCNPVVCFFAREAQICVRRDKGTEETKGFELQPFGRVLDVVEVPGVLDFPALLALKGRQNTDGGERSVTPGHGSHNKSPLLGEGRGAIRHSSFVIHSQ